MANLSSYLLTNKGHLLGPVHLLFPPVEGKLELTIELDSVLEAEFYLGVKGTGSLIFRSGRSSLEIALSWKDRVD